MPRTLKVFRTPIGFHDAYIATPTKKAAIEAWGSDKDIFSKGEAEEVTDPELTAEPLASPGVIIKRLRGTAAEQIAALGPPAQIKEAAKATTASKKDPRPTKPQKPRPDRKAVEAAEEALAEAEARYDDQLREITAKEEDLARERRKAEEAKAKETAQFRAKREKAEAAYQKAMSAWRAES